VIRIRNRGNIEFRNPITQLALTLANGFTYVEYYLARKMPIDSFAPNLSFFFRDVSLRHERFLGTGLVDVLPPSCDGRR
jgi:methylmalonyl-CoA mutase N-terminal domain/subunit